ncbi:RHS repeat-associated core domain-containing protein [Chloroflexota bacterium]
MAHPDFSSVIQELVDSYDYSGGTNAIQILVDDNSSASGSEWVGTTYDGGYAPQLILEWTTSGGGGGTVTLTQTWKYDNRGRVIQDIVQDGLTPYTTSYSYDSADRLVTVTYPTGEVVTQTYDDRSLPESLSGTSAGTLVSSTSYNQFGQIKQINLGNGTSTDFNYWGPDHGNGTEQYGKLWQIKTTKSPTTLQDLQYSWDANGNLTSRYDDIAGQTENFGYDFLDRLTSVFGAYSNTYVYNEIGNITSMNGTSYTYGTKPHAVTAAGSTSYAYDANGNMTTRGSQTITWDEENKPVSIGDATFVYDGDGNRIKKTESGETILYINQYYEKNLTTGEVTSRYYLGGREVAYKNNSGLTYVHQDSLGSTALTTNTSGSTAATVRYYPYGDTRYQSGSLTTDKLFTGQRLDDTGLYYYNARYYDATIGRFISADSIVPDWTNPQSYNRYSYVLNNPLKYTDPTGHAEGDWWDPRTHYEKGKEAGKAVGKAVLGAATNMTEGAITVMDPVLDFLEPADNVITFIPDFALNNTVVPMLNLTGAGINKMDLSFTRGLLGIRVNDGGWIAGTMNSISNQIIHKDIKGVALPTFGTSLVIINEDLARKSPIGLQGTVKHENIHVIQQQVLGLSFLPTYGLGHLLYGYDDNPLEVQAKNYEH